MSLGVSPVSFGSKLQEQKMARLLDDANKQAVDFVKKQRPVTEQKETLMREVSTEAIKFGENLRDMELQQLAKTNLLKSQTLKINKVLNKLINDLEL